MEENQQTGSEKQNTKFNSVSSASASQNEKNNMQDSSGVEPRLVGIKLTRGRSYFMLQWGIHEPEFHPVNMAMHMLDILSPN